MKTIIPKVDRALLDQELTSDKFLSDTNNGGNQIYVFTAHDSPHLMREVGRLRELTFRDAGGGTGCEIDIDKYDGFEKPFQQLIVWNPDDKEIVGGAMIEQLLYLEILKLMELLWKVLQHICSDFLINL